MTPDLVILTGAALTGLAGGGHCAVMCGGLAAGFPARGGRPGLVTALLPNLGRLVGYAAAGAVAGGLGHGIVRVADTPGFAVTLRVAAGAVLLLAGLRLLTGRQALAILAGPQRALHRLLAPLQRRLLPLDSDAKRFAAGILWGWLPCGLSTTLLALAWLRGNALDGTAVMAAFGLGTLPVMLPLTWAGARLGRRLQDGPLRLGAGAVVTACGLVSVAAPWLAQAPALHGVLASLGCLPRL
jgi:uncharacterized protein